MSPRTEIHANFNIFLFHRGARRAAPVQDGKQEGGQHVFHDLVH